MATPNKGTKFRRISSGFQRYHPRSASTGDILINFPPSYPEVTSDIMVHSAATGQDYSRSSSSSRNGGSFDHLMEGERVGFSTLSSTCTQDTVTPRSYDVHSEDHLKFYNHHAHSHASGVTKTRGDGGSSKRRSFPSPPSHPAPLLSPRDPHSRRESSHSHSERELDYIRLAHHRSRDSMSQDTIGEREFDHHYRYDINHSSTLPTLSLHDTHHREHSTSNRRHSWGRERGMNDDRDLRRRLQEFDVMPIHEAFRHEAMESPADEPAPPYPLSPPSNILASQDSPGSSLAVIDRQPHAATVESQVMRSPPENTQDDTSGSNPPLPHSYLPVFFSPESGMLYINVDGSFRLLPTQYSDNITDGSNVHPEASLNQPEQQQQHPSAQQLESSSRQTSSSYGLSTPYDYYYCSIVMMLLYILCLNIVAVFLCSIPALWFAKKAMQAKYEGDYAGTLSLGTRALCFNIIGGFVHILFLFAIMFTPILLRFVFDAI